MDPTGLMTPGLKLEHNASPRFIEALPALRHCGQPLSAQSVRFVPFRLQVGVNHLRCDSICLFPPLIADRFGRIDTFCCHQYPRVKTATARAEADYRCSRMRGRVCGG
jgi:hypothetical protein